MKKIIFIIFLIFIISFQFSGCLFEDFSLNPLKIEEDKSTAIGANTTYTVNNPAEQINCENLFKANQTNANLYCFARGYQLATSWIASDTTFTCLISDSLVTGSYFLTVTCWK